MMTSQERTLVIGILLLLMLGGWVKYQRDKGTVQSVPVETLPGIQESLPPVDPPD